MIADALQDLRVNRLNDELERYSPITMEMTRRIPSDFPADPQVLAANVVNRTLRRPLEVWREERDKAAGRNLYHIQPAFFEQLDVLLDNAPLDATRAYAMQPGDILVLLLSVRFAYASTTFDLIEGVFPDEATVTHTLYYKTGAYTVLSAEIRIVGADDDTPTGNFVPAASETESLMNGVHTELFFPGTVGEDGDWIDFGDRGHFFVGSNFSILSTIN